MKCTKMNNIFENSYYVFLDGEPVHESTTLNAAKAWIRTDKARAIVRAYEMETKLSGLMWTIERMRGDGFYYRYCNEFGKPWTFKTWLSVVNDA